MRVTRARRVAFDVLRRVEMQAAWAAEVLHARLDAAGEDLKPQDAALATELVFGTLRWQRLLDVLLARALKQPLETLDPEVRISLRMGLYQLRFLTRVPARAAVSESVELVRLARKRSAAPLVNAVLRRAAAETAAPADVLVPQGLPDVERLAILSSHPTWLVERWLRQFGETRATGLLSANNHSPRVTCALGDDLPLDEAAAALRQAGLRVEPGRLLRRALAVSGGNPAATALFREGRLSIQDEASQAVALLVDVRAGQRVLDLCAAPGGKTVLLARAAGPAGSVVAADVHQHRLRAMHAQLERAAAGNVSLVTIDATQPLPLAAQFERILVDAPCSGTGTLARNPEIRWRLHPADLADLQRRQIALLEHSLPLLAPGGRLVYSTCSLEPEENEQVVAAALQQSENIRVVTSAIKALAPHLAVGVETPLFDQEGCFRTFPPDHHTDGFFAAALERAR